MTHGRLASVLFSTLLLVAGCGGGGGTTLDGGIGGGPNGPDADSDGVSDADEMDAGTDPSDADSDDDGISDGEEQVRGTDPLDADSDDDGMTDGEEKTLGTDPTAPDEACADLSAEANLSMKPVDIIFVIDNSGSMTGEIAQVQDNINTNFAQIIGDSGLDYRIIMIAKHGKHDPDESVCISTPLSGHDCTTVLATNPIGAPVNGARYFHYSTEIGSWNSLQKIISTYNAPDEYNLAPNGWSAWLRADSMKVFVEITDDEGTPDGSNGTLYSDATTDTSYVTTADAFETALFGLSATHFGSAADRNYAFHTIGGFLENSPSTAAWQPADPIQTSNCTAVSSNGAEHPGLSYQELSKRTGGLRFPLCELSSFDAVFQAVAQGVVEGSTVDCRFEPPTETTDGTPLDLDRIVVSYTPGDGSAVQSFAKVNGAVACGTGKFYMDGAAVQLCPATCAVVQADTAAEIAVKVACEENTVD